MQTENRPLWAPWRIDFIRSEKGRNCFLCHRDGKFNAEEEELIIAKGKQVFVILNRYPYNSGHLLIAPYRHIGDIAELTPSEQMEMMSYLILSKKTLQQTLNPDGFNVGLNLGAAAGAGVEDHIHQHIVPRWIGDVNFMPVIGDTRVVPEALTATAELLRKNFVKT